MLKQVIAVTALNLKTLPSRFWGSLVIVLGVAGVVGVIVSVMALAAGLDASVAHAGRADRAIILRGGSDTELASTLDRNTIVNILDAPGIRRSSAGRAIGSAETVMMVARPLKNGGTDANITLRGLGPQGLLLRPEIKIVQGRAFNRGVPELIVGRAAQTQFAGLTIGSHVNLHNTNWTIVGVFASSGDVHESEIMGDAESLLSAFGRTLFQSVIVQLDSVAAFVPLRDSLTANPQLSVEVHRETDYLAKMSGTLTKLMKFIANVIGSVMAVGAVFGALNTMYSAVSARTVEIATLRAIGFGSAPIVFSVLSEALVLALLGGVIGAGVAWFFFNGHGVNALGGNYTQMVFQLTVTPDLMIQGIVCALVIGFIGGVFPAFRAGRIPVVEALRKL